MKQLILKFIVLIKGKLLYCLVFIFIFFWLRLMICGILTPQPGIKPASMAVNAPNILTTGLPGNSLP